MKFLLSSVFACLSLLTASVAANEATNESDANNSNTEISHTDGKAKSSNIDTNQTDNSAVKNTTGALPVYDDRQLLRLFDANQHLQKVKEDDCQLLQDIEARATKVDIPTYQFLYGDMLAWGVCVERDVKKGLHYMRLAANQGLPAALEQLGRYYLKGTLVNQNQKKAVPYLRQAAYLGNFAAKVQLANIVLSNENSRAYDYELVYLWLYEIETADQSIRNQVNDLLKKLEKKIPPYIVTQLKQR